MPAQPRADPARRTDELGIHQSSDRCEKCISPSNCVCAGAWLTVMSSGSMAF
jgi:hypothetical protein